jgi:YlmC/YmxH family sporulation protein
MTRISELGQRDVVNVTDGRRLGNVVDLEVDLEKGVIKAIVIPGPGRILGILGSKNDHVIPWEKIRKIGPDVILVEMPNFTEIRHS